MADETPATLTLTEMLEGLPPLMGEPPAELAEMLAESQPAPEKPAETVAETPGEPAAEVETPDEPGDDGAESDEEGAEEGGDEGQEAEETDEANAVRLGNKEYHIDDPGLRHQIQTIQGQSRARQSQFDRVLAINQQLTGQVQQLTGQVQMLLERGIGPAATTPQEETVDGRAHGSARAITLPPAAQAAVEKARQYDPDLAEIVQGLAAGIVEDMQAKQAAQMAPYVEQQVESADQALANKMIEEYGLEGQSPDDIIRYVRAFQEQAVAEGIPREQARTNKVFRWSAWSYALGQAALAQRGERPAAGTAPVIPKNPAPVAGITGRVAPARTTGGITARTGVRGAAQPRRTGDPNLDAFR